MIMGCRALHNTLNGRFTVAGPGLDLHPSKDVSRRCMTDDGTGASYDDAISQKDSNYWTASEYSASNAWRVNFGSGNVNNSNNNNKYNGNVVRAVAAYGVLFYSFYLSLLEAYKDCLRGKSTSQQAVQYLLIANEDLICLAVELWTGSYKPGTSTCFLVKYPKLREVFAAQFRDRIVHHWICLRLNPLFEERFCSQGNVSFNCRKKFGTDAAINHIVKGIERVSDHYSDPAWAFHGDLVGFFMSIDKDQLWYLLERFINRWHKRFQREGWSRLCNDLLERLGLSAMPEMYWDILLRTTKTVVMHHPELDCVLNSPAEWWLGLEPNKSLFTSLTGEPIGNLTTQLFANFLMSYFVAYVLWLFRRKNFDMAQFVDDFILICDDLSFLVNSIPKVEDFLRKLRLTLHRDKQYLQPVTHGLMFVGTCIKPGRLYLSNRTRARFEERCIGFRRMLETKPVITVLDIQRIEQVINSYLGFCKGRKTYKIRRYCIESIGPLFWKFFYVKGSFRSIRARRSCRQVQLPFSDYMDYSIAA